MASPQEPPTWRSPSHNSAPAETYHAILPFAAASQRTHSSSVTGVLRIGNLKPAFWNRFAVLPRRDVHLPHRKSTEHVDVPSVPLDIYVTYPMVTRTTGGLVMHSGFSS